MTDAELLTWIRAVLTATPERRLALTGPFIACCRFNRGCHISKGAAVLEAIESPANPVFAHAADIQVADDGALGGVGWTGSVERGRPGPVGGIRWLGNRLSIANSWLWPVVVTFNQLPTSCAWLSRGCIRLPAGCDWLPTGCGRLRRRQVDDRRRHGRLASWPAAYDRLTRLTTERRQPLRLGHGRACLPVQVSDQLFPAGIGRRARHQPRPVQERQELPLSQPFGAAGVEYGAAAGGLHQAEGDAGALRAVVHSALAQSAKGGVGGQADAGHAHLARP
jgi:hypothetical protein